MDNALKIINALWQSGVLTTLAIFVIKFMSSHTKTKNLKLAEIWALQAVQFADKKANVSADKKEVATHYLGQQLHSNKLAKKFSENEIDAMLEVAVKVMQKNGGFSMEGNKND